MYEIFYMGWHFRYPLNSLGQAVFRRKIRRYELKAFTRLLYCLVS